MRNEIYEMKLHDNIECGSFAVTRVPGGWIYFDKGTGVAVFVPFNNEFLD